MNKTLILFLSITFAICWSLAGLFYLTGSQYGASFHFFIMASVYMLVPGVVAIALDKKAGRRLRESLWIRFRPNRWWLVALLASPILVLLSVAAACLIPGVGLDPEMGAFSDQLAEALPPEQFEVAREQLLRFPPALFFALMLLQGFVAGATLNALLALGEELGWRAFMIRELASKGFWNSALIIGAVWGLWHAPLVLQGHNYPEHPVIGVFMMTIWCMALSPLYSLVTLKARSVIAPAIMHGVLNATGAMSIIYLSKNIPLVTGIHGLIGFALLAILNLWIFFFVRPTLKPHDWSAKPSDAQPDIVPTTTTISQ